MELDPVALSIEEDEDSSSVESDAAHGAPLCKLPRCNLPASRFLVVTGVVALMIVVCALSMSQGDRHATEPISAPHLQSTIQESSSLKGIDAMVEVVVQVVEGVRDVAKISDAMGSSYSDMSQLFDEMNMSMHAMKRLGTSVVDDLGRPLRLSLALKKKLHSLNATEKDMLRNKLLKELNITSLSDLFPHADINEQGKCSVDEELHGNLCYKKCSLLTDGRQPFRVTAFECCAHKPPCLTGASINTKVCEGYAVSSDTVGGGCPHTPGGCLKDEELFEGMCYMQCNLLTYGMLKYRSSSSACCKQRFLFNTLEPGVCDIDAKYDIGGGQGDGDLFTPSTPHMPLMRLLVKQSMLAKQRRNGVTKENATELSRKLFSALNNSHGRVLLDEVERALGHEEVVQELLLNYQNANRTSLNLAEFESFIKRLAEKQSESKVTARMVQFQQGQAQQASGREAAKMKVLVRDGHV
jgi:hypothetical protein